MLVTAIAALWIAGGRHGRLMDLRQDYHLDPPEALEQSPPLVAFTTVALGGFRGILVDILWVRLSELQQEGRYFEIVQLADWITKLEPRSSAIWAFQAWNMSYNISVMMSDYEDRWRWVRHGVELLRDDGLRYNPANAQLHRELGWLFQHKMGADSDRAHWLYKRQWYLEMQDILGGARPDYEAWRALPPTREQLRARPGMAELVAEFRALGYDPFLPRWLRGGELPEDVVRLLREHPAAPELLTWLRGRALIEIYRMDLDAMEQLEAVHGPLDWRIPETHALYWAERGLRYAGRQDEEMIQRMIFQSLVALFQRGRYTVEGDLVIDLPDLRLFEATDAAYRRFIELQPENPTYRIAYENFLQDALVIFYNYQRRDRAAEIFARIREVNPEVPVDMPFSVMMEELSEYIAATGRRRHSVIAIIDGLLQQGYRLELARRETEAAVLNTRAQDFWQAFMAHRVDEEFRERTGLPPLEVMRRLARDQVRREREPDA